MSVQLFRIDPAVTQYAEGLSVKLSTTINQKAEYYNFDFDLCEPKSSKVGGGAGLHRQPSRFMWTWLEPRHPCSPSKPEPLDGDERLSASSSSQKSETAELASQEARHDTSAPQTPCTQYKRGLLLKLKADLLRVKLVPREEGTSPAREAMRACANIHSEGEHRING